MFGSHTPVTTKDKGPQSPMAVFTRGLQRPGQKWKFRFDNGYGASVINDGYGAEEGLYELAVLDRDDHLTYSTPVTDDVLGWLTVEQVVEALDQIEALTPESIAEARLEKERRERDDRISELEAELAALRTEATS